MKNEIGRKLTSLTIMAIMFAGGMTLAVPGFMPDVTAAETTSGLLTVSTTTLQGVAVLEIVVNDPDVSATDADIAAISASVGGTSYDLTQATNGKWYAYVVDASQAALFATADTNGFEFGILCGGIGVSANTTTLIVPSGTNVYVAAVETHSAGSTYVGAAECYDLDNASGTSEDAAVRQLDRISQQQFCKMHHHSVIQERTHPILDNEYTGSMLLVMVHGLT